MNVKLEAGFKAWLVAEGIAIPIYTGFTGEIRSTDDQTITVYCDDSERVTGPLYRCSVKLIVATPPHDEDDPASSLGNHSATADTLRGLLEDYDESELETTINAETTLTFCGGFLRNAGESSIEGGKWVTTLDFVAGISTA